MIYLEDRPLVEYEYWIPTKKIELTFHHNFNMNRPVEYRYKFEKHENDKAISGFYVFECCLSLVVV